MNKGSRRFLSVAAAVAVSSVTMWASTANAVVIAGIEFGPGATFKNGFVAEAGSGPNGFVEAEGDTFFGVGRISEIQSPFGNPVWSDGQNSRELTFVFDDYVAENIFTNVSGETIIWFSGGEADFYSQVDGTFDAIKPTFAAASATANGTAAGSVEFLNLVGAGTGTVCVAADGCFNGVGSVITLEATIGAGGTLISILGGSGSGFFDVDMGGSGAANAHFNSNYLPAGQDLDLGTDFSSQNAPAGSFATVIGSLSLESDILPEPGSLAVFGLGLLGLGLAIRRKRTA